MGNFLAKHILIIAYALDTSVSYAATKSFFKNLLLNDSFRYKKYFDYAMVTIVFLTVGIYLYDIKNQTNLLLDEIEIFAILVFIAEYLLRFWVHSDVHKIIILRLEEWDEMLMEPQWRSLFLDIVQNKLMFILHPMSIIDLLSIHPELRPLRLFKIFRYSEITRGLFDTLSTKKYEFGLLFVLIFMTVFIASSLFYVFESDNPKITNYFDAVYWAVITIATVGYGDVVPSTTESKIASIFLVFAGLGVLAMLTSLVTTTLGQKISAVREQKNHEHIEKLKDYALICGFGKMGEELSHRMHDSRVEFIIVDFNRERVEYAKSLGFKAFFGDATRVETLKALDAGIKASSVICITNCDTTNISIILATRSLSSKIKIISKASEAKNEEKMRIAGANDVIGLKQGSLVMAEFLNSPIAYQAIYQLVADDKRVLAEEIQIPFCKGILLSNLEIDLFGCITLGVKKTGGGFKFNPKGDFSLEYGDTLIVIGKPRRIEGVRLKILRESMNG